MNEYIVYCGGCTVSIMADNFTFNYGDGFLRFEKDNKNIAYFMLDKITGFKRKEDLLEDE